MTGGEKTVCYEALYLLREIQETKCVRDSRARLRENLGEFLLGQVLLFNQLLVATCLFNGGEVRPLKILNEGKLKNVLIRNLSDDDRYLSEPRKLRCLITTLSCNNLVVVANLTNKQRLKHTVLLNRVRKLIKLLLIKLTTRLIGVWLNFRDL